MKICHISSAHPTFDTRIFYKECCSLANAGFETFLIIGAQKNETINNINIVALNKRSNRIYRMLISTWVAFFKAIKIKADVYHIHDPELLPFAFLLKLLGKPVIYDSHEDYQASILSKQWISPSLRKLIARAFTALETVISLNLTAVACATPSIKEKFEKIGCRVIPAYNYPILTEFPIDIDEQASPSAERIACYVGAISKARCATEMIQATALGNFKLLLGGNFSPPEYEDELRQLPEWKNVEYLGYLNREQVVEIYRRSKIGLILFKPMPNHMHALPNKLFEYMAAKLPVIASNFPHFKNIVNQRGAGLTANPNEVKDIAKAADEIFSSPENAIKMGENGRDAVVNGGLNWENHFAEHMLMAYKTL